MMLVRAHAAWAAIVVVLGLMSGWASAQDDRWLDTPTGWTWYFGVPQSTVSGLAGQGQRVFNIERVGGNTYDAVAVSNSGPYAVSGSQIHFAQTLSNVADLVNNQNRRIIDLEIMDIGAGVESFTLITVPNSGATAAGWGWQFRRSQQQIIDWVNNSNPPIRLIDLDSYIYNGVRVYSAVGVHNTGSNAMGWWYYFNRTPSQVTSLLQQNNARLVSISMNNNPSITDPNPRFNVVMVANNPGGGWWYFGLTPAQIEALYQQNGARLTCLTRYTDFAGQTRFAVAMVDNVNQETRRVRNMITSTIPSGTYGFRAKQVGGPVISSLHADFDFEPASMIKILHTSFAMRRVDIGLESLSDPVTLNTTTNSNTSCPFSTTVTTPTLQTTIRETMRASSNHHTEALRQRYGTTVLNLYAGFQGLSNTELNHTLGCLCSSLPNFNRFSARDAVSLYELISDGTLMSESSKQTLYNLMLNYSVHGNARLTNIINDEAASTNLTASEVASFRAAVRAAWKGGSYTCLPVNDPSRRWRTEGGWARLPFKAGAPNYTPFDREYAVAIFLHDSASPQSVTNLIYDYTWELLRVPIRQALQSWDAACAPDSILSHPAGTTAPVGGSAQFSVSTLTGAGSSTYRWQRLVNGVYQNIFDSAGRFSGATTPTLTISNIQQSDDTLYRLFITKPCGNTISNSARLVVTPGCVADFDGNGVLNFFDFAAFIAAYNAQDPAADLAPPFGVWNFFDVAAFIDAYNAGCP
ncbi:MAG: serine hydrolase [Phycisphaerales bacterium]|nr:serine hydrolase [Planctomycetota bacterium]MCH8509268.1 serine hydrolase [Phycisphaerales bacterium]